jgi:hypothetical protein
LTTIRLVSPEKIGPANGADVYRVSVAAVN